MAKNTRTKSLHGSGAGALTPEYPPSNTAEFAASQQKQIAELCARLAGVERRFNAQQQRIGRQDRFIETLTAEGNEARLRLRFLENAAKLTAGQQ